MIDLGTPLGAGKEAEIFAWGADVLKLSRRPGDDGPARREAAILRAVAPLGLAPQAREIVEIEGRWGLVMERIEAPVLGALAADPARQSEVMALMLTLHRRIHAEAVPGLMPLKTRLAERIGRAAQLDATVRDRLLARLAAMPDAGRVCHGDFHPFNILGTGNDARVVDWLDATSGEPAADVCRTFVLIRTFSAALAAGYVTAYAAANDVSEAEIYAWLPMTAAARLVENVPDEDAALVAMAIGNRP